MYYSVWELAQLQINQLHLPPTVNRGKCVYSICLSPDCRTGFWSIGSESPQNIWPARCYKLGLRQETLLTCRGKWQRACYCTNTERKSLHRLHQTGIFFPTPQFSLCHTEWVKYMWFSISGWRIDGGPCLTYQHAAVVNVQSLSANELSNFSSFPGENCRSFLYVAPSNERGKNTMRTPKSPNNTDACGNTVLSPWC